MQSLEPSSPFAEILAGFASPLTGPRPDLEAFGARYLAKCKKQAALARFVAACPPNMRRSDFRRPIFAAASSILGEISAGWYDHSGLLLSGPSGLGKSRIMWSLMLRLAKLGKHARYFHASDFFSDLQAQVNYGRDDAGAWIKTLACVPVVYIDDLGQEAVQRSREAWSQDWFFRFLDLRSNNGLPLYVTTNLTAEQMAGSAKDVRAHPMLRRLLMCCKAVRMSEPHALKSAA